MWLHLEFLPEVIEVTRWCHQSKFPFIQEPFGMEQMVMTSLWRKPSQISLGQHQVTSAWWKLVAISSHRSWKAVGKVQILPWSHGVWENRVTPPFKNLPSINFMVHKFYTSIISRNHYINTRILQIRLRIIKLDIYLYLNICFLFNDTSNIQNIHYTKRKTLSVQSKQSFPLFGTHTLMIRKGFTTTESLQTMWHYISLCTARCAAFLEKKTSDRFLLKMMMFFDSYLFFPKKNPCFNMFSRCCHLGALFQWMWNVFSICSSLFCAVSVWQQLLLLSCASRKLCSKVACLAEHGEDGDMQGLPSMLGAIARILLSPFKKKYKEV